MPGEDRLSDALAGFENLTAAEEPAAELDSPLIPDDAYSTELAADPKPTRGGPLVALGAGALVLAVAGGIWFTTRPVSSEAAVPTPASTLQSRKPGMPDPALTPGDRAPEPREESPVPIEAASAVTTAYGVDPEKHVVVRLIPASLGGTDNPQNLFPVTPWFADLKRRLDRKLTTLVAEKALAVEDADLQLRSNWVEAVHRHYIRNYGHKDAKAARNQEDNLVW